MALAFAKVYDAEATSGTFRETVYDVTLDSSYPTAGEAISARDVGLTTLYGLVPIGVSSVAGTAKTTEFSFVFDYKNSKLQALATGAAADAAFNEAPNATNLSTYVVRVRAIGV